MLVIMGATGQVGGAALEALKQRGAKVRAVSRVVALSSVGAHRVLPSGKLPLETRNDVVSALDVGRVAAELLFEPRPGTRIVNVLGPAQYSPLDAAEILSRRLGRTVTAVPSSSEETVAGLTAAGLGVDYAEKLADLDEALKAGRLAFPANGGELRRGTITLETVLQRLLGEGR